MRSNYQHARLGFITAISKDIDTLSVINGLFAQHRGIGYGQESDLCSTEEEDTQEEDAEIAEAELLGPVTMAYHEQEIVEVAAKLASASSFSTRLHIPGDNLAGQLMQVIREAEDLQLQLCPLQTSQNDQEVNSQSMVESDDQLIAELRSGIAQLDGMNGKSFEHNLQVCHRYWLIFLACSNF